MPEHSVAETIEWMNRGTEWCLAHVATMSDADFGEPSQLPNWSRAHLVAHLARNAEALERLLLWARTGVETPMYSSPLQRSSEIEAGSLEKPTVLRAELLETIASLARAVEELPELSWAFEVRSATGRTIPAGEVPWLRTREVWLHTVDLGTGAELADLPSAVVHALIVDMVGSFATRPGIPSMRLETVGEYRQETSDADVWSIGDSEPSMVRGPAVQILAWLSGRDSGRDLEVLGALPNLPPWL
jgi:maleylpyruvate isomerase